MVAHPAVHALHPVRCGTFPASPVSAACMFPSLAPPPQHSVLAKPLCVTCHAEHDRSSYVDATADHVDLFSVIRKYIRPDAFDVHHEGHHKEAKTAPPDEPVRKKKKEVKASRQQPVQEEEPSQEDEGDDEDYEDDEVVTFST